MEPFIISTFLLHAVGYILKGAAQSKTAETVKESILSKFWGWVKPHLIENIPDIENEPDNPETETKIQEHLLELIKNEVFFKELTEQIAILRHAGVKEKNIVKKDIERVKKVRIGDKEYSANEIYDRKNIIDGGISDVDEFVLGDGH